MHAGRQRARHVGPQDQQFGHLFRADHIAVGLAIDLEAGDRTQDRRPVVEVELDLLVGLGRVFGVGAALILAHAPAVELALDRVKLDVQQPGGVVGPLQEAADAQEVKGLVLQHGAHRHAA